MTTVERIESVKYRQTPFDTKELNEVWKYSGENRWDVIRLMLNSFRLGYSKGIDKGKKEAREKSKARARV